MLERLKKSKRNKWWLLCELPGVMNTRGLLYATTWEQRLNEENWYEVYDNVRGCYTFQDIIKRPLGIDTLVLTFDVYVFGNSNHFVEANAEQEAFIEKLDAYMEKFKVETGFRKFAARYAEIIVMGLYYYRGNYEIHINTMHLNIIQNNIENSSLVFNDFVENEHYSEVYDKRRQVVEKLTELINDALCHGNKLDLSIKVFIKGNPSWNLASFFCYDVDVEAKDGFIHLSEDTVKKALRHYMWWIPGRYYAEIEEPFSVIPKEFVNLNAKPKTVYKKLLIDFANAELIRGDPYHDYIMHSILTLL